MLLQSSHVVEQKILFIEMESHLREFADWSKYDHLARVVRFKY